VQPARGRWTLFIVAEKLILAAGTYPGQWTYRDQVVSGEIQLEGSQMPVGQMFDAPATWVEGTGSRSFEPHEDTAEMLRGRLRSGHETVLLSARIQHLLPERSWVHGQYRRAFSAAIHLLARQLWDAGWAKTAG
jgi:hypothetical protein